MPFTIRPWQSAMRPSEVLSLTVTLPNDQRIEIPKAVACRSTGQEFAIENLRARPHACTRLQHYIMRLVRKKPAESVG